jgi:hypothetical protein
MPKAAWMLAIAKEAPTRCLVVGGSIAFKDENRVPAYSNAVLKYVVMAFWRVSEMSQDIWVYALLASGDQTEQSMGSQRGSSTRYRRRPFVASKPLRTFRPRVASGHCPYTGTRCTPDQHPNQRRMRL